MDYLDTKDFKKVRVFADAFQFHITPFRYLDGRYARLPRRRSPQHNLPLDTAFYFTHVLKDSYSTADNRKYSVDIIVRAGKDKLGNADIDNYCKAILDGITSTKKIWIDDKQVDILTAKRLYTNDKTSSLRIKVKRLK